MNEEWIKQESNIDIWLPGREGDELTGVVKKITEGNYGKQYVVLKKDNSEVTTPSHKVLQNRMQEVKEGNVVKIVYTHSEAPKVRGQNPTMMYDVFIRK